jgi:ATP-dependent RNA helicase DDX18/HAS1
LLNYVDIKVKDIHGDLKQSRRNTVYLEFFNSQSGILLCTDVAQRGLDFPDVDWVIQYDPPHTFDDYIHRIGRTARGANGVGKALLLIYPTETGLIKYFKENELNINEYDFDENKLMNIQDKFENLIESNIALFNLAVDAYKSFLQVYKTFTHSHSDTIKSSIILK